MVKILNLNGMGSHSFSQLLALQYIENVSQKPISSFFDVIIGQSSGGLIATYLTTPCSKSDLTPKYKVSDIIKILKTWHDEVFNKTKVNLNKKEQDDLYHKCILMFNNEFGDLTFDDLILPIIIPTNQLSADGYRAFIWSNSKIIENKQSFLLKNILPGVIALKSLYPPHPIVINEKITYHYDDANLGFSLLLHAISVIISSIELKLQDINILSLANNFLPFVLSSEPGLVNQHYKGINDLLMRDTVSNIIAENFFENYLRIDLSLSNKRSNYQYLTLKSSNEYLNYYASYLNDSFFDQCGLKNYIDQYSNVKKKFIKYHKLCSKKHRSFNNFQCIDEDKFNLLRGISDKKFK